MMIRTRIGVIAVATAVGAILSVAVASEPDSGRSQNGLTLLIEPATLSVDSAEDVVVTFRLVNTGNAAITVCTWPGILLQSSYVHPESGVKAFVRTYPTTDATLSRADFKELGPHESITGTATLSVFPTPVGYLRVYATFRSGNSGSGYKLNAWKGEVRSKAIDISVPRSSEE